MFKKILKLILSKRKHTLSNKLNPDKEQIFYATHLKTEKCRIYLSRIKTGKFIIKYILTIFTKS